MLTNYNRHFFMRLNMKKSKSVGLVVAFIIIILISAVPGVISIPMMPAGSQVSSYGGFLYG